MSDIGTFISEHAGALTTAGAAYAAVVGTVIAGHIQGKKALRGAEAQAKAALDGAQAQANKALEAAREQARAALEVGRQQVEATLAGVREASKEAHAQWQRDRCQEVWAEYVKELDVLLAKDQGSAEDRETEGVLKAYAMVELISPAGVLSVAGTARDDARLYGLNLFVAHQNDRNVVELWQAQRRLRANVEAAAGLEFDGDMILETIDGASGPVTRPPGSHEANAEMRERHRRGLAAQAALDALDAAERDREVAEAGERARQLLLDAGFSVWEAGGLADTVQRDHAEVRRLLEVERGRLQASRDAFVAEARRELDALGR
ncbi:hypothetical protein C0216_08700 [Streptomyces globosus]|uniref:Uncharacterized protein n=1 Tax=Streptomyces globosus TaxID=68209 RepID=A0A344TY10_9ACTN|nr:hypothetical protein [Streptomyces globosus]AXE23531.1 hypothetical protein C0216_08700 [Streptomyces globosus]